MPAPRKYSDAQRQALWRLHEAGLSSAQLASAAESGRTGLASFTIPTRTVRSIIGEMSSEMARSLPTTVVELDSAEAMERAPARAAQIVEAELDRLEGKQRKRCLTDQEIDRLPRLATYSVRIAKLLQRQGRQQTAGDGANEQPRSESPLEKLAREQSEREGMKVLPSPTHTCQPNDEFDPETAATVSSDGPPPDLTAELKGTQAQRTPAERAEAAQKARAFLAA